MHPPKRVKFWTPNQETAHPKVQSSIHDYRSRQVGSCAVSLLYIGCNNTWKLLALQKRIYSSIIFVAYNSTLFRAALCTLYGRSMVYQLFYSKRRCFEILSLEPRFSGGFSLLLTSYIFIYICCKTVRWKNWGFDRPITIENCFE